jgi:glycine hydroxymethyltransferase
MVPNDPEKPAVTSGVRLGTAAMTTRGMGPDEMREIADIIVATTRGETSGLHDRATALTEAFPLYE